MDVISEQLMDAGLNALGYLVAGGLGMLVYSVFRSRRRVPAVQAVGTESQPQPQPTKKTQDKKVEFINLLSSDSSRAARSSSGNVGSASSAGTGRRDRTEIVRLAREMIKAGTPHEMIKRTLPITDGELALLRTGNNRQ